jgi:hypothetical protein
MEVATDCPARAENTVWGPAPASSWRVGYRQSLTRGRGETPVSNSNGWKVAIGDTSALGTLGGYRLRAEPSGEPEDRERIFR